ncbi:MAG: FG-GAP-like repeat-containing protein [Bacteroidales bacterium]
MKLISLIFLGYCLSIQVVNAQTDLIPLKNNQFFSSLQAIKAGNSFIDVCTGHAAPAIYDFNKDGKEDLIVGEFGNKYCPDVDSTQSHAYVQARCRIYLNEGSNSNPVYNHFTYLMASGKAAYVPNTCCNSFVPRFLDLDGDDIVDIISGSYPGEIYFFKGTKDNQFEKGIQLKDHHNNIMHPAHSAPAEPVDWNGDGLTDILVSSRGTGEYIILNIGDKKNYKFSVPQKIELEPFEYYYKHLEQIRKAKATHLICSDWDNDGLFDLIGGCENSQIVFYKNIGSKTEAKFAKPILLWDMSNEQSDDMNYNLIGGRLKLFIYDYNKDGKKDLLVGDVIDKKIKIRDLSPKEEYRKKILDDKILAISKELYGNGGGFKRMNNPKTPKSEKKELMKLDQQFNKLYDKTKKYEVYKHDGSHGYVWVLTGK